VLFREKGASSQRDSRLSPICGSDCPRNEVNVILILTVLLSLSFPALLALVFLKMRSRKPRSTTPLEIDKDTLDAAEKALRESEAIDWVVLKRCHGPAYSHTAMSELVSLLNAEGIDATFDVISSSSADGGVTNFSLKVLRGSEADAFAALARHEKA
jgi:hypothetical protein